MGAGGAVGDRTREEVRNGEVRVEAQERYLWWQRVTKLSQASGR